MCVCVYVCIYVGGEVEGRGTEGEGRGWEASGREMVDVGSAVVVVEESRWGRWERENACTHQTKHMNILNETHAHTKLNTCAH